VGDTGKDKYIWVEKAYSEKKKGGRGIGRSLASRRGMIEENLLSMKNRERSSESGFKWRGK